MRCVKCQEEALPDSNYCEEHLPNQEREPKHFRYLARLGGKRKPATGGSRRKAAKKKAYGRAMKKAARKPAKKAVAKSAKRAARRSTRKH